MGHCPLVDSVPRKGEMGGSIVDKWQKWCKPENASSKSFPFLDVEFLRIKSKIRIDLRLVRGVYDFHRSQYSVSVVDTNHNRHMSCIPENGFKQNAVPGCPTLRVRLSRRSSSR